jgi:putative glutamine amidotransferase
MKWLSPIFAALLFMILPQAKADSLSIRLYEWSTPQTIRPLILPVKAGETPQQAAARYIRELERQPDLMELFEGRSPDLSQAEFKPFGSSESISERALLMANAPRDYTQNSGRVESFTQHFTGLGTIPYILPINANLGLNKTETRDLFKMIANEFPLLVNLGGDDVDPRFYKQENFHARNTIPIRDQFEIALIRAYIAEEKGVLFAVCRGAQITAIALGYKLVQDIPFHIKNAIAHANDYHPLELLKTTAGLFADAVKGFKNIVVNSIHHQFIVFKEGGPLELAAVGPDGITEALESKNGRIFLLQFHPELMGKSRIARAIIQKVIAHKNKMLINRCQQNFEF